ncbi:TrmB family transcriptional regulator [Halalkalicoccus salilacus]|uniref:TrmB family transcriptional regulator n=1 Tax=Halalkalicoccus salilacus TaxID=3117459 RepID=UPI00300F15F6
MSPATLTRTEATATDTTTLDQMPAALDSSNSKLVYLYLATVDEATISELQSTLEMQQLALFPTLDTLEGEGLIEREGETFTVAA